MRFNPVVSHKPGKELVIADALSRNPIPYTPSPQDLKQEDEIRTYVEAVLKYLPVTNNRLEKLHSAMTHDDEMQDIINYVLNGWPTSHTIDPALRCYYRLRDDLSVVDGLLIYQNRIVIPKAQRDEMLFRLHETHQGFAKCIANAERCVWWPGLHRQLKEITEKCRHCAEKRPAQRAEPLKVTPLPARPWEKIAADLCIYEGKTYLVIVDYYSRWIEVKRLYTTTSTAVISKFRQVFATHGIPDEVQSDNGPQFSCKEFAQFASDYGFHHTTSSPYFAQANGAAEAAVKVAKKILSSKKPDLAILNYRSTPHYATKVSPAVALMGRNLNTRMPILPQRLLPTIPNDKEIRSADHSAKAKYKSHYDRRHGVRTLPPLKSGDQVLVRKEGKWSKSGVIVNGDVNNRTYVLNTNGKTERRNRNHLMKIYPVRPVTQETDKHEDQNPNLPEAQRHDRPEDPNEGSVQFSPRMTRSRMGVEIKKPLRYRDEYE